MLCLTASLIVFFIIVLIVIFAAFFRHIVQIFILI